MTFEKLPTRPMRPRQRGFTLVESMIALLVLSVGLIAMAALHGQGLSASRTAMYRTMAVNLSADMADRIRANRLAGTAYNNAASNHGCTSADCTPAQLAENDLFVWDALVGDILPNGTGTVAADDSTDPATYTIQVTWDEVGEGQLTHESQIQVPQF